MDNVRRLRGVIFSFHGTPSAASRSSFPFCAGAAWTASTACRWLPFCRLPLRGAVQNFRYRYCGAVGTAIPPPSLLLVGRLENSPLMDIGGQVRIVQPKSLNATSGNPVKRISHVGCSSACRRTGSSCTCIWPNARFSFLTDPAVKLLTPLFDGGLLITGPPGRPSRRACSRRLRGLVASVAGASQTVFTNIRHAFWRFVPFRSVLPVKPPVVDFSPGPGTRRSGYQAPA